MLNIRKAQWDDLNRIEEIFSYARKFMKENGNPEQWKDDKPSMDKVKEDIRNGNFYVIESDGKAVAVFAFPIGIDPTYLYIEDGQWLNDEPYGTIHRIASDGKIRGVLKQAVDFAGEHLPNVRVDTHHDNQIMQHQLLKLGFTYCGTIYLLNGDPRRAYHKIVEKAAHV